MLRRSRFADLIARQLDLFEREHREVIDEAAGRLAAYNNAERDEAEERYGDYGDAIETGTELLAEIRDHFAQTLEEGVDEEYEREFNRVVGKRLSPFALEIENR